MPNPEKEFGTKVRLLRLMRTLIERPFGYTRQQLATKYNVHPDTITNDFKAFVAAGFEMDEPDERYRYSFIFDKPMKRVAELLYFSEEERAMLHTALDNLSTTPEKQRRLKDKLRSLYDYSRLGFSYLRRPHMNKVELLEQAKHEKKQVVLEGYRSSHSNSVADRVVEPYHISPAEDTLQSFDVDKHLPRHFRISRIARVRMLEQAWQFEGHHNIQRTDAFRIVDNEQVNVHLRLSVGARNELEERYPLTRAYIMETADPNFFDFQCMVNSHFYGLSNFILGFYHLDIEVLAPESLREHLRGEVAKMKF
ncbi:MAG TPA: WYL domain-containing protein [Saprospiraceae bacterium]|nr:WYL domain-containing protein [Saprospiraceae bacterium]HND88887.1 WYL domain-containing protein [Saprospiraceae bacterium]